MNQSRIDHEPWPLRAALLAALGAVLGLLFDLFVKEGEYRWTEDALRLSAAAWVAVGGIAFAFTLERLRPLWSALFGLAAGLVVAFVFFWNGTPDGWTAGDEWRVFSAVLAIAVAAPLFQSVRDAGRWRLGYEEIHAHAWTNIVLWCAAWAFVLISWLLAQLLAELFNLIGIGLLREALHETWFTFMIVGAALGGAVGLLRDRDKVLGLLQRVVTTVLSVLAPVLATGLVLFVAALPFTGLDTLWEKTSATTPILLACIAGAFFLANAVIGNSPEEEAKAKPLRWSAMALGAVMTPLALVAAISTWLRIDQHGFSPQRLWALVFLLAVIVVSAAYLWALVRGRLAWAERVRPANIRLALGICALALLLATPILNFGAISTRDQLARLESGRIAPEKFDWAALRFDFGSSGRKALERLSRSDSRAVRALAAKALKSEQRWGLTEEVQVAARAKEIQLSVRVRPVPVALPEPLHQALARGSICAHGQCTVFWEQGAPEAVAVGFGCVQCGASVTRLLLDLQYGWQPMPVEAPRFSSVQISVPELAAERRALTAGQVEIREVTRRQVFVGGRPVAGAF